MNILQSIKMVLLESQDLLIEGRLPESWLSEAVTISPVSQLEFGCDWKCSNQQWQQINNQPLKVTAIQASEDWVICLFYSTSGVVVFGAVQTEVWQQRWKKPGTILSQLNLTKERRMRTMEFARSFNTILSLLVDLLETNKLHRVEFTPDNPKLTMLYTTVTQSPKIREKLQQMGYQVFKKVGADAQPTFYIQKESA